MYFLPLHTVVFVSFFGVFVWSLLGWGFLLSNNASTLIIRYQEIK